MKSKWKDTPRVPIVDRGGLWFVDDTEHLAGDVLEAVEAGHSADRIHLDYPNLPEGSLAAVLRWKATRGW